MPMLPCCLPRVSLLARLPYLFDAPIILFVTMFFVALRFMPITRVYLFARAAHGAIAIMACRRAMLFAHDAALRC